MVGLPHCEAVQRGNLNIFVQGGIFPAWRQSWIPTTFFSSARSISIKSFNISLKQYVCSSQFMDMLRYSNLSALLQIIKFSQVQI